MKKYLLATDLDTKNSILAKLGKNLIIIGHLFLLLSIIGFILLVLVATFDDSSAMGLSGVPIGIGIFGWILFVFFGGVLYLTGRVFSKILSSKNENT